MFLLQNYNGWTQRILQQAFDIYTHHLAEGESDASARHSALLFLKEAGMDQEVAAVLLGQAKKGDLQLAPAIQSILTLLAAK
jgi:hypothetical protein